MSGEWDEALRLLRPAMDETDRRRQEQIGREAWLEQVKASSPQYADPITEAVEYFLNTLQEYRPDVILAIRAAEFGSPALKLIPYVRLGGYILRDGDCITWVLSLSSSEWLGAECEMPCFKMELSGRWSFERHITVGHGGYDTLDYGFNADLQFVPSSFPLVEHGTVETIARLEILALLHHYGLPLPS